MGSALSDVLPLGLGVAVSPFPLIALLLMLLSDRELINAWAFLCGWAATVTVIAGLTALTGITIPGGDDTPAWIPVGEIVIGIALLITALVVMRRRARGVGAGGHARWLAVIDDITPPRAAALAMALVLLNAKDLALTIDAGTKVSEADLAVVQSALVVLAFAATASVSVLIPVLVATFAGERAEPVLRRWHDLLDRHGQVALALVCGAGGVVLVLAGLTGAHY